MSTLVRMPSGCMPANRASPDDPDPVPISTTASGLHDPGQEGRGRWRRRGRSRHAERSGARGPRRRGLGLGDEVLGVRPGRGLGGTTLAGVLRWVARSRPSASGSSLPPLAASAVAAPAPGVGPGPSSSPRDDAESDGFPGFGGRPAASRGLGAMPPRPFGTSLTAMVAPFTDDGELDATGAAACESLVDDWRHDGLGRRHDRGGPDHLRRREVRLLRGRGRRGRRSQPRAGRRRHLQHRAHPQPGRRRREGRCRRTADRHPVLLPAAAGRSARPLPYGRRRHHAADHALRHPAPFGCADRHRHAAPARRAPADRRRQGRARAICRPRRR